MSAEKQCNATTEKNAVRLNKYIASCGICSRRDADRLIENGDVVVNGEIAVSGTKVFPGDSVKVKGKMVRSSTRKIVVAYYKPVGVTCTERDPHARLTLSEAFSYPVRLTYAGRLDRDSEGLLLMTNDGELIDAMMRGSHLHEKEYTVRLRSRISDAELNAMRKGIYLKDLETKTRSCEVKRLGDYTFSIVLTQGLNRQIRRMCRVLGHEVKFLKRVRVLTVRLGNMHPGEKRELNREEMRELYEAAGLSPEA